MGSKPQQVVLQIRWVQDGRHREELFGPWTQGDPDTDDGSVAHMVAAHRFLREWCAATGIEPGHGDATAIIVNDPDDWLRDRQ